MRRSKLLWALPFLALATPAQAANLTGEAGVATIAEKAMQGTGARGLAIAVIDGGKVKSVQAFGERNAKGDPLTPQTIMYGASLTKLLFSYAVMRLVDEGKVDLDRSIADMLPQPLPDYGNLGAYGNWGDLKDDPRWRAITPRMALNHSTGFPNFHFLEPDGKLRIHFDPGTRYSYSGEGVMLLQFAIEKALGIETGAEVKRLVFDPLNMPNTGLTWRPDFAANYADGWRLDGSVEPHDERGRVRMAGSMDTTITDLANFTAALVRGEGLSTATRAEMVRADLPIRSRAQFPTLAGDAPAEQQSKIAAGVGTIVFSGPQGPGFIRGGHNDSTGNILVCVERRQRCVLVMANDVRAEASFPMIVREILGETGAPWAWLYGDMKFI